MSTSVVIPNYGTLISSGISPFDLGVLWQSLTQRCLGMSTDPTSPQYDVDANAKVRVEWPTDGQPGWTIEENAVFLACVEVPNEYSAIRDRSIVDNGEFFTQTTTYTRVWEVSFEFRGPLSSNWAMLFKSCLFEDFVSDTLFESNLHLLTELDTPRRVPEMWANQWWERVDFAVKMNEGVTETIDLPKMASVEIITADAEGNGSDNTINFPGYSGQGFGGGNYSL